MMNNLVKSQGQLENWISAAQKLFPIVQLKLAIKLWNEWSDLKEWFATHVTRLHVLGHMIYFEIRY